MQESGKTRFAWLVRWMGFEETAWVLPVIVAIHNAEKVLAGSARLAAGVEGVFDPAPFTPEIAARHLYVTMLMSTMLAFAIPWLAAHARNSRRLIYTVLALQWVVVVSTAGPHLAVLFVAWRYTPGLVTALLLILPLSLYFFASAVREGLVTPVGVGLAIVIGTLACPPFIALIHIITVNLFHF